MGFLRVVWKSLAVDRHLLPADRNRRAGGLSRPQLVGQVRPAAVHRRRRLRADSALARQPAHPPARRHARLEEHSGRAACVCRHLYAGLERRGPHRRCFAVLRRGCRRRSRTSPVWRIALNAEGFRSPPITKEKRPGALRIACIGDSWTFGMNVNQDATYPGRLEALLKQQRPGVDLEVMNFGVLGYSSFQGLQLLKSRVLDLHPDVLVIGFGMNDSSVVGYRDKDVRQTREVRWRDRVEGGRRRQRVLRAAQVLRAGAAIPAADHRRFHEAGCEGRIVEGPRAR